MARKIAIVGFATTSREQCPKTADEFELWGLNHLCLHMSRPWSRWFEMHDKDELVAAYPQSWNEYREWLKRFEGPVYFHEKLDEFPNSAVFPMDEIATELAEHLIQAERIYYYCSTVAYALAMAIHELGSGDEIHMYGIDMVGDDEYGYQRPNCEWLTGYAMGKGINVYIPPQSALLTSENIYGKPGALTDWVRFQTSIKRRCLEVDRQRKDNLRINQEVLKALYELDGSKKAFERAIELKANHNGDFEDIVKGYFEQIDSQRGNLKQKLDDVLALIHGCDAAIKEGDYYLGRLRSIKRGGSPLLVEMEPSGGEK